VPVVPGYVRCPKCHAALAVGRAKRSTVEPGGTAVEAKGFPISAIVVAVAVAAAIMLVFGLLSGSSEKAEVAPAPVEPIAATPAGPPPPPAAAPATPAPASASAQAAATPDPRSAATTLEATLRRQRLWSRVDIVGTRIDIRSGSCADPAMVPAIEGSKAELRSAGLTKLRCVEQSGAVVFEHSL
jgi:hypothetical protein